MSTYFRPEKPPPASEPTLPAKDSAPPKPLRKAQSQQSASTQQSVSVPVKPPRPRSTHEPDRCMYNHMSHHNHALYKSNPKEPSCEKERGLTK